MALEIIDREIIGTIDNLKEKLSGKIPINRLELIHLINSWGRYYNFYLIMEDLLFRETKPKECYDLSRLDISEITDMSDLFKYSNFNGDISQWNTSNVTNMSNLFDTAINFNSQLNDWKTYNVLFMDEMFYNAESFNQDINSWDTSNVKDMGWMFNNAKNFDKPILWDLSKVETLTFMFDKSIAFENRFNNGKPLPKYSKELKEWLKENRDKMIALDLKDNEKEGLEDFYSNFLTSKACSLYVDNIQKDME